jgi:hypothetical protein
MAQTPGNRVAGHLASLSPAERRATEAALAHCSSLRGPLESALEEAHQANIRRGYPQHGTAAQSIDSMVFESLVQLN